MSNPVTAYQSLIDVSQPNILQGANNAQTNEALLYLVPSFRDHNGNQIRTPGIGMGYFALLNRSGGAAYVGIGVRIPNSLWVAGQWDDSGGPSYIDDTTAAQDRTANDFALETTTVNDGYVIASQVPFNAVSIDVTTASIDAVSVARAARYSDTAGTGWSALTTILFTASATNYVVADETILAFDVPVDWGRTTGLTEIPNGLYAVNVRATDAPTTAGLAAAISIYRIYFLESISNNATKEINLGGLEMWMQHGDAATAFFSTANASNRVSVLVRPRG